MRAIGDWQKRGFTTPSLAHGDSVSAPGSFAPQSVSRGCGATRADAPRPATCSRRSTAGSPRASRRPTSRRPRRCSTNWHERALSALGFDSRARGQRAGCRQPFEMEPTFVSRPNLGQPNGFSNPYLGHRFPTHCYTKRFQAVHRMGLVNSQRENGSKERENGL
jgi:hypothetical protein